MIEIAKQYKRLTASKYAPVAEDEMLSKIMEAEKYYVSPKYDVNFPIDLPNTPQSGLINVGLILFSKISLLKKSKCSFSSLAIFIS